MGQAQLPHQPHPTASGAPVALPHPAHIQACCRVLPTSMPSGGGSHPSSPAAPSAAPSLPPHAQQLLDELHAAAERLCDAGACGPQARGSLLRFLLFFAKLQAESAGCSGAGPVPAIDGSQDGELLLLLSFVASQTRPRGNPAEEAVFDRWIAACQLPATCVARLACLVHRTVTDHDLAAASAGSETPMTHVMLLLRCVLVVVAGAAAAPKAMPLELVNAVVSVSTQLLQSHQHQHVPTALINNVVCSALLSLKADVQPPRAGPAATAAAGPKESPPAVPQGEVPEALVLLVCKCVVQAQHDASQAAAATTASPAAGPAAAAKDAWLRVHAMLTARLQACASFCQGRKLAGMEWRVYQAAAKVKALAVKVEGAMAAVQSVSTPLDQGSRLVLEWATDLRVQGGLHGASFQAVLLAAYALAEAASGGPGGSCTAAAANSPFEMIAQSALLRDRPLERIKATLLAAHNLTTSFAQKGVPLPSAHLLVAVAAASNSSTLAADEQPGQGVSLWDAELLSYF